MVIYRHPVPSHPKSYPPVLPCLDFAPRNIRGPRTKVEGDTCRSRYAAWRRRNFSCPNLKNKTPGYCWKASFLYPRGWRDPEHRDAFFHFHQGIDIAGGAYGEPVHSVTGGFVRFATDKEYKMGCGGYGRMVVVEDIGGTGYRFLYAHLKEGVLVKEGDKIKPGQQIGFVGNSGTKDKTIVDYDNSGAHVHFEVVSPEYTYRRHIPETKLSDWGAGGATPRLDPLAVLESLGPYESTDVFIPGGSKIEHEHEDAAEQADLFHQDVENSLGGFFPLGANNVWHGGVHLSAPMNTPLVAPFEGEIVAFRLHPDPAKNLRDFGCTNFILLRHQISERAFALLQREGPLEDPPPAPPVSKPKKSGVGLEGTNPEEWVVYVKQRLNELGYYNPDEESLLSDGAQTEPEFIDAIKTFQEATKREGSKWRPDGLVEIPGRDTTTWGKLHGGKAVAPPPLSDDDDDNNDPGAGEELDPKRTIYSLLMHLDSIPLEEEEEEEEKRLEQLPWLKRVQLEPTGDAPDPSAEEKAKREAERQADLEEISSLDQLSAKIGPNKPNRRPDVEWVQKRLNRLNDAGLPTDGVHTDAVHKAIKAFQATHVDYYAKREADGVISPGKGTWKALRKTKSQSSEDHPPDIDPGFRQRVQEVEEHGAGKVISGQNIKVKSGEALWFAGHGIGFTEKGTLEFVPQFHWEIFSEHELLPSWEKTIDDSNDDLTIDAPQLVEQVDQVSIFHGFRKDGVLQPSEIQDFYRSGKAKFLRQTKCRFRSEWAMDLGAAIPRLEEKKFADPKSLLTSLPPYLWWDDAADVLPPTKHVWHYNPIEFLRVYAEVLGTLKPPPAPVQPDPDKFSTVRVDVVDIDGNPGQNFDVSILLEDGQPFQSQATSMTGEHDPGGIAVFPAVPVGTYTVKVQGSTIPATPIFVKPREVTQVELRIELKGPPPPNGELVVRTRDHGNTPVNGVSVGVFKDGELVVPEATSPTGSKRGEVTFKELPFGTYTIKGRLASEDLETEEIEYTLNKKKDVEVLKLLRPWGNLVVKAEYGSTNRPASDQSVAILQKSDSGSREVVASGTTDANGEAHFRLRIGLYIVAVGDAKRTKQVWLNKTKVDREGNESAPQVRKFDVEASTNPGTVQVIVIGEPKEGRRVSMRLGHTTAYKGKTDADGTIVFEDVTPGKYKILADDANTIEVEVAEGAFLPVTLLGD